MDITDFITRGDGGRNLELLARQFGLDEAQARAAVDQLAPAVEAGIRRETTSPEGLSGLLGALAKGNHARYLDGKDAGITDDGNAILGHIFGSKDVSRGVAAHAAAETGIGDGILKQMLPMIAAMVMGSLAKKVGGAGGMSGGSGGGIGDILGQVLGGGGAASPGAMPGGGGAGGLGDILGQVLGGSGMGGGAGQMPGGAGGGLGDILGQVLGGASAGQPSGAPAGRGGQDGGGFGDILNSMFGADAPPEVRDHATRRAGDTLGKMLGGSTSRGSAADDLLASVQRAVRR